MSLISPEHLTWGTRIYFFTYIVHIRVAPSLSTDIRRFPLSISFDVSWFSFISFFFQLFSLELHLFSCIVASSLTRCCCYPVLLLKNKIIHVITVEGKFDVTTPLQGSTRCRDRKVRAEKVATSSSSSSPPAYGVRLRYYSQILTTDEIISRRAVDIDENMTGIDRATVRLSIYFHFRSFPHLLSRFISLSLTIWERKNQGLSKPSVDFELSV